jgi:hypothetical protein
LHSRRVQYRATSGHARPDKAGATLMSADGARCGRGRRVARTARQPQPHVVFAEAHRAQCTERTSLRPAGSADARMAPRSSQYLAGQPPRRLPGRGLRRYAAMRWPQVVLSQACRRRRRRRSQRWQTFLPSRLTPPAQAATGGVLSAARARERSLLDVQSECSSALHPGCKKCRLGHQP